MVKKEPLVSIVIPVYNGANYLGEAIQSALAQTYSNVEVIVVNDGSNDDGETDKLARKFGDKIRYFFKENGGVSSALNLAIREMRGDYFSWLSHDDLYYPDKIAKQMDYINRLDRDVILYGDYDFIDDNGNYLSTYRIPGNIDPRRLKYSLMTNHSINGCTVLIPKYYFQAVGLFDEMLLTVQDYEMWYRMADMYEFHHVPDVLIKSRLHNEQGTNTKLKLHIKECNNFYASCLDDLFANGHFYNDRDKFNFFINSAFHAARFKRLIAAKKALDLASFYSKKNVSMYFWYVNLYFLYKKYKYFNLIL